MGSWGLGIVLRLPYIQHTHIDTYIHTYKRALQFALHCMLLLVARAEWLHAKPPGFQGTAVGVGGGQAGVSRRRCCQKLEVYQPRVEEKEENEREVGSPGKLGLSTRIALLCGIDEALLLVVGADARFGQDHVDHAVVAHVHGDSGAKLVVPNVDSLSSGHG